MKILFAGTPDFAATALAGLIESHQVVGVFTQPDRKAGRGKKLTPPPVKVLAQQHDLPIFQPSTLNDQASTITDLNVDVMVVVAYGMILPQQILDIPPLGCINIHASLLPRWRGAAPIQRAIEAGDTMSGVSIMKMDAGLDTGPVYQTLKTPIEQNDTSASMHEKLAKLGAKGVVETLNQLKTNPTLKAVKQDETTANYAKKISKTEASIDWTVSANQIQQRIRAFIPWPVSQTYHQDIRIRLWQSSVIKTTNNTTPGEVIDITANGICVACGTDALCIEKLQRDGSKPMSSDEFINGYSINIGDHFITQVN